MGQRIEATTGSPEHTSSGPFGALTAGKTMPNQPRPDNRARAVRVDDRLWVAAQRAAAKRGTTVSAIIRAALERYVK